MSEKLTNPLDPVAQTLARPLAIAEVIGWVFSICADLTDKELFQP